jgi:hypothetical protein
MPRREVENNNWARLGEMILDIWSGRLDRAQLEKEPQALLAKYGVRLDAKTKVQVHFDEPDMLHVVIPYNQRSESELRTVQDIEAYKRELGVVVMGGCR